TSNIFLPTLTYNNDNSPQMSLSQLCTYLKIHSPFPSLNLPLTEPNPTLHKATQAPPAAFPTQSFPTVQLREENHFFTTAFCGRRSVGAGVGAFFLYSLLERKYSLTGRDLHSSCLGLLAYLGATPCVRHFFMPSGF
ncbi:hypothetical protein HOY80DRAFT_890660, partial [Tuber brumale]